MAIEPRLTELLLDDIELDPRLQVRVQIDQNHVRRLAEDIENGAEMEAVDVWDDGITTWMSRGFHRHAAHRLADQPRIKARVHIGRFEDAFLYALGSNSKSALHMTKADKRREAEMILSVPELKRLSDRELGRRYCISASLFSDVRHELQARTDIQQHDDTRTVTRNGKTFEQKVTPRAEPKDDLSAVKPQIDDADDDIDPFAEEAPAAADEPTAHEEADRIARLPLYQALQAYGHKGRNFLAQAQQYYATRKLVERLRAEVPMSASGPYTDLIAALYNTPDPSQWTGCPTCHGSHYPNGLPCPDCKEGYVTHANGVSAEEFASHARERNAEPLAA